MTVVRRELPRSRSANSTEGLSHRTDEDSPFVDRPISSLRQGGPQEAGEFAGDRSHDVLFRFAAGGETSVASGEALLGLPGDGDRRLGRALLATPEVVSDKGMVAIVPGGLDEDAPHVGVAGDAAPRLFGAAGMLRGDQPDKGHQARGRGKAAGVAQFCSDRQGGQVIDATKTSQSVRPGSQRLELAQVAQLVLDGAEAGDGFIHRAEIRAVGLLERRQRPDLGPQPSVVALRPRPGRGKAAPVAEQKLRQAVASAEQIGADVFATAKEVARGFFLLGGNVDRGEGAGAEEDGQVPGVVAVGLDAIARAAGKRAPAR